MQTDRTARQADGERTSFGFREVKTADKQRLVDDVFDAVAGRYDLMNDLMSGGVHRLWKDAFVTWLAPPRRSSVPFRVLDMAGGTGDIAFRIAERSASGAGDGLRHQRGDAGGRPQARRGAPLCRPAHLRRGQCRGADAFADGSYRRGDHRLRHPQRAAHRPGAGARPSAC